MTFVAKPNDLNSLFSHMIYESVSDGYDNITISIYDGIGGECLTQAEHMTSFDEYNFTGPYTIHKQIIADSYNNITIPSSSNSTDSDNITMSSPSFCHDIEKVIQVQVIQKESNILLQKNVRIGDIPIQLWIALITLFISFLTISVCTISSKHHAEMIEKAKKMNITSHHRDVDGMKTKTVTKKTKERKEKKGLDGGLDSINESDDERTHRLTVKATPIEYSYDSSNSDNDGDYSYDNSSNYDEDYLGSSSKRDDDGDNGTCEWIQHYDASSGNHYYENIRKRRVTWTKPDVPFMHGYG